MEPWMRRRIVPVVLAATLCAAGREAGATSWFGTECQEDYQNGWRATLGYTWQRCHWFNQELDDTDLRWYYYDLHGARSYWETASDQYGMDDVDLVYATTHGGAEPTRSTWAMWDSGVSAKSYNMRLGDEALGLSIFATYSCETQKTSDGLHWQRLGALFRGGLRFTLGSHDKVYASVTTNEVGEDFADGLQKGKSFKYAWKDGNSDWWEDQDLTVMTTGVDANDCHYRRANMNWHNFHGYARLRDAQAGWVCWSKWDDI
jgi:hypothetical protein